MVEAINNVPTIFVAFGATGDLMQRKVIPALFHLHRRRELPDKFRIIGFSRRDWSHEQFQEYISGVLEGRDKKDWSAEELASFLKLFRFQQGTFEDLESYKGLRRAFDECDREWKVCSNKLFYLSVAPEFYEEICRKLREAELTEPCASDLPGNGWTRVIVEKPFGVDLKTAKQLDELLGKLFKEKQIYRIDHYLAKEMLQNILTFRFSNNLFELPWGSELIDSIHIRVLEALGVEKRGAFYDGVGALRDVGQNHFLQMLALVTMDHPTSFEATAIQKKRAEILEALKTPTLEDIKNGTYRAQYEGYRQIQGVKPDSNTETYFKVRAALTAPKWQGVPIIMEGGKRLGPPLKEIIVTFKHPKPCLCPPGGAHHRNQVIIRMEPREEILIEFWSKKPGFTFSTDKRMFHYMLREESVHVPYVEEYAKLLLDCVRGDQSLFISTPEIRAMWRFTDPILEGWGTNIAPLNTYKPDSTEALENSKYIDLGMSAGAGAVLKKEIAVVGLGKMGGNIVRRLMEKGWTVYGYDASEVMMQTLAREGMQTAASPAELVGKLTAPRVVWLMVPAGKIVDDVLFGREGIAKELKKGDVIIDGGNSYFKDSQKRAKKIEKLGIKYIDVGFSGGPAGARMGGCLMIGGDEASFRRLEPLFYDLSRTGGYQFFKGAGAGHFVKMVHNGIEYGMMQALAEGFALMKKSKYKLALKRVADIYNNGSVIESRLVGWLRSGYEAQGEDLKDISGTVGHTGEGEWTAKTAKEEKIAAPIIEGSFKFRLQSAKKPSYTGQVLSVLRQQFGGHAAKKSDKKK